MDIIYDYYPLYFQVVRQIIIAMPNRLGDEQGRKSERDGEATNLESNDKFAWIES